MKKRFALIGAAGYIAPRHMKAIKETDNDLVAALDPNDSVGIIDSYFPSTDFFTEFERFDRHIDKLRRKGTGIDYVSICSPNYLHDAHMRFALRSGADAICEKPLVLNPWNIDSLLEIEKESGQRIHTILQLRLHPAVIELKKKIAANPGKIWDIDLTYLTSRGHWYFTSWKGDDSKSGGISTNIGIHFFDMLTWIFGGVKKNTVHINSHDRSSGFLELENANVRWFLSINAQLLPEQAKKEGKTTYRSLKIGEEEFEFSGGFTDLHTLSYQNILEGNGFKISEAKTAIDIVYDIRNQKPEGFSGEYHPLSKEPQSPHPFNIS
ncbi:UDP-N-acetyl-2-amino-2-deoxyglucuronate dehydrogenase [Ekhidna lutea]|uniref:UDP-N-acetyl-2-amino-2-deoxyglucuronate dehydrogenase n=1 Tax=Ekhidna lutea TaxID=447679 RepID=A0A239M047_EKHLU|nr:Gfo/Idh/MocA family oxidoreductase [Ekhidna lutea]SNT36126.1 UDP-N-acetyl-2-amino-2-deoxyglucuronate dehydrogenase [Ekhidna lutea]